MGLFTRFKPLTSWTVAELVDADIKCSNEWYEITLAGKRYDSSKQDEIEREFLRRGLNKVDELNRKFSTFR